MNVPTIQADDCVASNAKGLFVPPPPRWPRRASGRRIGAEYTRRRDGVQGGKFECLGALFMGRRLHLCRRRRRLLYRFYGMSFDNLTNGSAAGRSRTFPVSDSTVREIDAFFRFRECDSSNFAHGAIEWTNTRLTPVGAKRTKGAARRCSHRPRASGPATRRRRRPRRRFGSRAPSVRARGFRRRTGASRRDPRPEHPPHRRHPCGRHGRAVPRRSGPCPAG